MQLSNKYTMCSRNILLKVKRLFHPSNFLHKDIIRSQIIRIRPISPRLSPPKDHHLLTHSRINPKSTPMCLCRKRMRGTLPPGINTMPLLRCKPRRRKLCTKRTCPPTQVQDTRQSTLRSLLITIRNPCMSLQPLFPGRKPCIRRTTPLLSTRPPSTTPRTIQRILLVTWRPLRLQNTRHRSFIIRLKACVSVPREDASVTLPVTQNNDD
jgi:hypothetical protein